MFHVRGTLSKKDKKNKKDSEKGRTVRRHYVSMLRNYEKLMRLICKQVINLSFLFVVNFVHTGFTISALFSRVQVKIEV